MERQKVIAPPAQRGMDFNISNKDGKIVSDETTSVYKKEASRIASLNKVEDTPSSHVESYPMNHKMAKLIKKYGHQIDYGVYKVAKDLKTKTQSIKIAGLWKMKQADSGDMVFVRNYNSDANIKAGDNLVASHSFNDVYGSEILANQYFTVEDSYEDVAEIKVAQTGATHVCRASEVLSNSQPRKMVEARRKAGQVVPDRFKEMIKAYAKNNDDELDRALWGEYVKRAGVSKLNDYDVMKSYVDGLFGGRTASQKPQRKAGQRKNKKNVSRRIGMSQEAVELELYINNDGQLYKSQFMPQVKNLMKKRAKGQYDSNKAIKMFMYLVDAGAKKYIQEFASSDTKVADIFPKKIRAEVAESIRDDFESEAEIGGYDDLIASRQNKNNRQALKDNNIAQPVDKETKNYYKEMWGDTDPGYGTEMTASEKIKQKREAIRRDYETIMSKAPSRNALAHHNNTIAKLARKWSEKTASILDAVNDKSEAIGDGPDFKFIVNDKPGVF